MGQWCAESVTDRVQPPLNMTYHLFKPIANDLPHKNKKITHPSHAGRKYYIRTITLSHGFRYCTTTDTSAQHAYGPNSVQPALTPQEVQRLCKEFKDGLFITMDKIEQIEQDTGQTTKQ